MKTLIAALFILLLSVAATVASEELPDDVGQFIQSYTAAPQTGIEGRKSSISKMLALFYRARDFHPAWIDGHRLTKQAGQLLDVIKGAEVEGLRAWFYNIGEIEALMVKLDNTAADSSQPGPELLARLDLMLTESFLSYSNDLIAGRTDPSTAEGEWADYSWEANLNGLLSDALNSDTLLKLLTSLTPPHSGYKRLKAELAAYREHSILGGWPAIPPGPLMKEGGRGGRVAMLRERLIFTNDLDPDNKGESGFFDKVLAEAVIRFQARHGLEEDGVVGEVTLDVLNVPVEERIRQMELNLERWRWLPDDLGRRYIMVNSADFSLSVIDYGKEVMTMRIIVGKPFWHTPSFSSEMARIVFNPSWTATPSIAVEDLVPRVMDDPDYLARQGFILYRGWGKDAEEVDPAEVEWEEIGEENLIYRFTQQPGPLNPLGRVKFIFNNPFDIYMHDTSSKGYFSKQVRTFSHGCIRLEKPFMLAEYLLDDDPEWSSDKITEAVESGEEQTVWITKKIGVHLLYWTAWVDEEGMVRFRSDMYDRDSRLNEALFGGSVHARTGESLP